MDFVQQDHNAAAASQNPMALMPSPDLISNQAGKENLTADLSTMTSIKSKSRTTKKSRSKSIGPGGLDALKEDPGNRRKSAVIPVVKSILKPTIPLSPPKPIPPHASARGRSPNKSRSSPSKIPKPIVPSEFTAIVAASVTRVERLSNPFEGSSTGARHSDGNTRVALRTEEEQQLAAKEREENAQRDLEKKEILERRDARRKSLANRRVSFAPEATLHTWDVVELPEDSTTSSASTHATRRASSMSAASAASPYSHSPLPNSDPSEPPSTPPEQAEQAVTTVSPAHQRDLHQRKRRRRSSAIPPMNFNNPDDEFLSSSPVSGSSVAGSDDTTVQTYVTADGDDSSVFEDDAVVADEGESTVMDLDGDDATSQSVNSARSIGSSSASTGSSGKLEEALRQAAKQAGTQGIEYDEHGDLTMDMADDEVTAAFQPWVKQGTYLPQVVANPNALQGQENINPFSPAFKASITPKQSPGQDIHSQDHEEMSMDITKAVGGILAAQVPPNGNQEQPAGQREGRSSVGRRRSSGQGSSLGDETMDFTVAIGEIRGSDQSGGQLEEDSDNDKDEELTMEFTTVLGGLLTEKQETMHSRRNSVGDDRLATQQLLHEEQRLESTSSIVGGDQMDMTEAVGGIVLETLATPHVEQDQEIVAMDVTTAIGAILPKQLSSSNKLQAKTLMEEETDAGQLSPFQVERALASPPRSALSSHVITVASETGSPSLTTTRTRASTRKSVGSTQSTPGRVSRQTTPVKKPTTPSKQVTPVAPRPTTPGKTPPNKNVTFRAASPKKLFKAEIKSAQSTPLSSKPKDLFQHNAKTGATTPSILLTPKPRILSGLGIDKPGLGSPRVAALLNRRGSIGEQAETFTPLNQVGKGVRFDDPRIMEQEVEREREEQQRQESGRFIMEKEADGHGNLEEKDVTSNLKEMIESLTPKKKKLNGRKSLHVGAAKGILGKRPAELDEDDEDENATPKGLKGMEGSPVKNVKLPGPPPKVETTGRVTRAVRKSLDQVAGNIETATPTTAVSSAKIRDVTTPKNQGRFKDVEPTPNEIPIPFAEKLTAEIQEVVEPIEEEERIHLQDFLNMTSIRFMELTTTKRRHTVAPNALLEDKAGNASSTIEDGKSGSGQDLESRVVAAACTVPMLDLFQHSCRELKKYISEGRSIVREIETDTFEDNPPLFREYISAAPEVRLIMDNQFKNVKTHARLSSKAMWYEWRMKLLDELKKGLNAISTGMEQDNSTLRQQENLLQSTLPALLAKHEALEQETQQLQRHAQELANCDQNELNDARQKLRATEDDIESKRAMIEEMTRKLKEKEDGIEAVLESKEECVSHIKEAERVREEYRGWSASEVSLLKANVDALEKTHGWTITAALGTTLTMTYRQTLQLSFDAVNLLSFDAVNLLSAHVPAPSASTAQIKPEPSSSITLIYIADSHPFHPVPLTTERRFFLNLIHARLQSLHQNRTKVKDILTFIQTTWSISNTVAEEARILNLNHITTATIVSDNVLVVKATLILPALERKTKVEVRFLVDVSSSPSSPPDAVDGGGSMSGLEGVQARVECNAKVVYGEKFNEEKMGEFLAGRIVGVVPDGIERAKGRGSWGVAVGELAGRLGVGRGKG